MHKDTVIYRSLNGTPIVDTCLMTNKSSEPALLISYVDETTIVETVYDPTTRITAFVVADEAGIAMRPDWQQGKMSYRPLRPTNNLVKHNALLFPSAPEEYGDTAALVADIEYYVRRYVSLTDSALALSVAYVLLTWVYDAFNELPYLRFRGDYGTGKTRALLVVGSLCYKAFFGSGASTISPIFHILDTFGGSLVFDEADFRFTDEKAELVKILNNGNVKGFPVLRTHITPKNEFDPRAFSIFGPKVVGMRRSFEDRALESRFLTVEMEPGQSGSAPLNLVDGQKDEALALRNKLLMYRLRNRHSVTLDAGLANRRWEARMNQILLPLLSVTPTETMRDAIAAMAENLHHATLSERSGSTEGELVAIVAELAAKREAPLPLAEVVSAFASRHGADYDRPVTHRWVGSILRRLGLVLYKSNGVVVLMAGQEERIGALGKRYGVAVPDSGRNPQAV